MEGNLQTTGTGDRDMNAGGYKQLLTVHPFSHSTPIHAHLPQKLSQMHNLINCMQFKWKEPTGSYNYYIL